MAVGVVWTYDRMEARGWIRPEWGGDLFFTPASIVGVDSKALQKGARVEYEVIPGQFGFEADNVRRL